MENIKVLLVDDDLNICKTLGLSLKSFGCDVSQAHSVIEASEALEKESFSLILTDFRMGNRTGTEVIRESRKRNPDALIAVMTAFASIENAIEVTKEGAFEYLPKPFSQAQLGHLLKKVRLVVSLKEENSRLKSSINQDPFSGFTSVAIQRLNEFVRRVAPTEATVLLVGESGTGKTELARLIHQRSSRANKPFIVVNCTCLAETLLESEIFGHVKGAFTGAIQDKAGKFELANHGTLFLDEIGDLSLSAQSKLLRFLQEKVIERVGSNHNIPVDARIIAATNKKLTDAVANGEFRQDLYFRLNVFECNLVPVRHRKEDILIFIHKFIQDCSASAKLSRVPSIPQPVMDLLLSYSWPGNIREIRNVIERILLLSAGKEVQMADLPDPIVNSHKNPSDQSDGLQTLEEIERSHICKILEIEPNLEKAAEILGITKVTLWRKRKEYGLP